MSLDLVKKLDSPFVGVCIDTGNNLALLEAPQETVDLLAPHAFTTHVKDMGVEEYADGFLLARRRTCRRCACYSSSDTWQSALRSAGQKRSTAPPTVPTTHENRIFEYRASNRPLG